MWKVEYIKEALNDFKKLDNNQSLQVLKAITKVSKNPLPKSEGGYGKVLGNKTHSHLSGYLKIKVTYSHHLKKWGLLVRVA